MFHVPKLCPCQWLYLCSMWSDDSPVVMWYCMLDLQYYSGHTSILRRICTIRNRVSNIVHWRHTTPRLAFLSVQRQIVRIAHRTKKTYFVSTTSRIAIYWRVGLDRAWQRYMHTSLNTSILTCESVIVWVCISKSMCIAVRYASKRMGNRHACRCM